MMQDQNEDFAAEINFPIDVIAEKDTFIIKALLPGVQPDDLDIQIINESVTISGQLKRDQAEGGQYLLAECPSGTFHRIITLPTSLDPNKVEAELDDGVLTVQIPKAEEAKPRLIKIKQK